MPRSQIKVPVRGRTAVITGAASGIGRAVALRLSCQGCPVALVDQDEHGLEETAGMLAGPVLTRKLDVRDRHGAMAFAAEVRGVGAGAARDGLQQRRRHGSAERRRRLARGRRMGRRDQLRRRRQRRAAFLPILLAQDSGAIVNTSSVFGLIGFPHQSAYCASKFAVRGYTDALRQELRGTGVSAVNVHPGGVKTSIVSNARFRSDHRGDFADAGEAAVEFEQLAQTTPERAAEIIHERGRARPRAGARRPRRLPPRPARAGCADSLLRPDRPGREPARASASAPLSLKAAAGWNGEGGIRTLERAISPLLA